VKGLEKLERCRKEMEAVRVAKEARLQRQFEVPNAKVDYSG
jgi:hypothetical protein